MGNKTQIKIGIEMEIKIISWIVKIIRIGVGTGFRFGT